MSNVTDVPPWTSVDPLGEALHFLRMGGAFYSRCEFTAPWGLAMPRMDEYLMFHVVTSGQCYLELEGAEAVPVASGELLLVPHGEGHKLVSQPGHATQALFDLPRDTLSERYELLRLSGGGEATSMLCGAIRFEDPAARQLLQLLPKVLKVRVSDPVHADWMHSTLRLIALEAHQMQPGGEAVITRLADILVIQAIRSWLKEAPAARTGWLGALRDHQVGHAIALVHRDPARPWTVASLAAEVAMSRSAFSVRFSALVGMPVMQYVTQWRMHLALGWLQQRNGDSLARLATRVGYQSEAAFSRAFKRYNGISPGAAPRGVPAQK